MSLPGQNFCICTLAFGSTYRALAKGLADDIEKYSPEIPFVIFTDKPNDFKKYNNVLIFQHKRRGVLCYHERRFAIAKALSMFNSCMYLDADVRLCSAIPQDLQWQPGITARSCAKMATHLNQLVQRAKSPKAAIIKTYGVIQKMAQKVDLDLEKDDLTWINEFLFVVTRDGGRELEFLDLWGKLALFAELQGQHKGPAYAIGLAAAKVGFPIRHDVMSGIDFFDDRIEKVRISKGESDPTAKQHYFEAQKKIENQKRPIWKKAIAKLTQLNSYYYHSLRLKLSTFISRDFKFYYR
ncbi:MAG: hypothetical protein SFY66_00860 [Oculatellaceae cyanobacterium bins.114]|nr:hypothetical protein [Oculatellaceae cyanobacterium bins.114]